MGLKLSSFFLVFPKKAKDSHLHRFGLCTWVWCDKFINWFFGPNSEQINGGFFMSGPYDTSLFLAYLFVIPSLAFFVVKSETSFYLTYREYIINIEVKASYDQIEKSRENMMKSISRIMRQLAAFQLIFTGAGLVFSTEILELLKLDASHNAIFRFGIVGATFHVFFLFTNITLLYLAEYRFVLTSYLFFLATNSGFTLLNQYFHPEALGIGYAFSTLLTLCLSLCFLRYVLDDFDYFMFSKQPFALTRANQLEEGQFKL